MPACLIPVGPRLVSSRGVMGVFCMSSLWAAVIQQLTARLLSLCVFVFGDLVFGLDVNYSL